MTQVLDIVSDSCDDIDVYYNSKVTQYHCLPVPDDACSSLVLAEVVPTLKVLLTDNDTLPEILANGVALVKCLSKSGKLMKSLGVSE